MRQSKSEFHAGRQDLKPIAVVHYFVPSSKRFKSMTKDERSHAKKWLLDQAKHLKEIAAKEFLEP